MSRLRVRCQGRAKGWVFSSTRGSRSGHLVSPQKGFRQACRDAGIADDILLYTGRHTFGAFAVQQTGNLFAVRGSDKVKPSRVRIVKRAMGLMEVKKALGSMRGIPQELSAAQHTVSIPDITAYLRPLTAELLRLEAAIDNGASPKPPIDLLIV